MVSGWCVEGCYAGSNAPPQHVHLRHTRQTVVCLTVGLADWRGVAVMNQCSPQAHGTKVSGVAAPPLLRPLSSPSTPGSDPGLAVSREGGQDDDVVAVQMQ